jgi:hypothetical protein
VVSDRRGDIDAAPDQPQGFFFRDTRFLSRWVLTANGKPLNVLSTDDVDNFSAQFVLYPATGTLYRNSHALCDPSAVGGRRVPRGPHRPQPRPRDGGSGPPAGRRGRLADLFEVKGAMKKKGDAYRRVRDGTLVLGYRREDFVRETLISAEAEIDEDGLTFSVKVEPHGEWRTCIDVMPGDADAEIRPKHGHGSMDKPAPNMEMGLAQWIREAPELTSSWDKLGNIYRRSLVDLAALRFCPDISPEDSVPAAGLPWFMALFGQDSVITRYQALLFVPELAETTLRLLAGRQGQEVDAFRDEEPGKILHELRVGELTRFGERPHRPTSGPPTPHRCG